MAKYSLFFLLILILLYQGCEKNEYTSGDIPTFISDFESRLKDLNTARNLELWKRASTGESDSLEYYDDLLKKLLDNPDLLDKVVAYRKIVSGDVLKRKLDLMFHYILRSRIDSQPEINNLIDSLNDELAKFYGTLTSEVKKSDLTYFLCEYSEDNITTKNKKLFQEIGNGVARLIRLRNLASKRLGYNSFYSINEFIEYGDAVESDRILDQLEEKSRAPYQSILDSSGDMSLNNIEGLCDLLRQQSDLKSEYGYYFDFSEKDKFNIIVNTYKSVGFDLNKLPIYFISPESTVITDIARCFPINCSNDIRIVTNRAGSSESFYSLFNVAGFAIYLSNIKQDSYLFQDDPASLRAEIIQSIFDNLISTEKWRNEYLSLPDDFAFRWRQDAYKFKVIDLRSRLLMARFEKQLYLHNALEIRDIFRELFERIMERPTYNSVVWWAVLDEYINRPFHIQRKLIAGLAAAQILGSTMEDESGFGSSLFKYTLVQDCFAPGHRYSWYDMLLQITGEDINVDYYLMNPDSTMESDD